MQMLLKIFEMKKKKKKKELDYIDLIDKLAAGFERFDSNCE